MILILVPLSEVRPRVNNIYNPITSIGEKISDRLRAIFASPTYIKHYLDTSRLTWFVYAGLSLPSLGSNFISRLYSGLCIRMAEKIRLEYLGFMVRGSDCDTIQAFSRFYEPKTKALLNKILGRGGVFIDAGAAVGSYTLIASKIIGNKGLVVAFEPVPRNYLALLENLRTNNIGNVIAVPYAL